jgi:fumarate hydratase class II
MQPLMTHNLLESIHILGSVSREFADRCVEGITVNRERCQRFAESTAALATALAPSIGYDKAAEVAKKVVLEEGLLSEEELDRLLDFRAMTEPGIR